MLLVIAGCDDISVPPAAGVRRPAPRPIATGPASTSEARPRLRLLFVGLDGADWEILRPLIREGRCPNLGKLAVQSATGTLDSPPPRISPMLWTSIVTGRYPEDHGILDFWAQGRGSALAQVGSSARRARSLWDILGDRGLASGAVGFWATHPPTPIRGVMVSDAYAPSLFHEETRQGPTVAPADWDRTLAESRVGSDAVEPLLRSLVAGALPEPRESDGARIEKDPVRHLEAILRSLLSYHRAALEIADSAGVDALFVYHEAIDEVCHRFMQFTKPGLPGVVPTDVERFGHAIDGIYELEDRLLGELLARTDERTIVIVVSDHGFLSGPRRLQGDPADFEGEAAAWHRDQALFMVRAPDVTPTEALAGTIYDVAPTTLALLGIPAASDMPGRALVSVEAPRVPTYGAPPRPEAPAAAKTSSAEELAKLKALGYVSGSETEGQLSANGYINLGMSFAARERTKDAIAAYRHALAVFPDHPLALYDLASALDAAGSAAEAFPFLVRLCRLDARLPLGATTRLADLATRLRGDAMAKARQALDARPDARRDGEWRAARAAIAIADDDPRTARELLVRSVKDNPELPQPILMLLACSSAGPEKDEARRLAAAALDAMRSPPALDALATGLAQAGENELAARARSRAIGWKP